jgi:hypothetical protein
MDKALRGQGCVMKRQKKADGGAMRDMPENLKEYLEDRKPSALRPYTRQKGRNTFEVNPKKYDEKGNLRSIIEDKTILINREQVRRKRPRHK